MASKAKITPGLDRYQRMNTEKMTPRKEKITAKISDESILKCLSANVEARRRPFNGKMTTPSIEITKSIVFGHPMSFHNP